ncbi:hypothetical protein ABKW28_12880 [Nocardioides sp. 31GB23]|uniref:hypothetical protein n=1 Tax=Nocardioides sp. 31GB23 TaxID=3156065 RepID=UPI0032AFD066
MSAEDYAIVTDLERAEVVLDQVAALVNTWRDRARQPTFDHLDRLVCDAYAARADEVSRVLMGRLAPASPPRDRAMCEPRPEATATIAPLGQVMVHWDPPEEAVCERWLQLRAVDEFVVDCDADGNPVTVRAVYRMPQLWEGDQA